MPSHLEKRRVIALTLIAMISLEEQQLAYNGLAAIRDDALCWATIGPTPAGILNIDTSNIVGLYDLRATVECLIRAGAVNLPS